MYTLFSNYIPSREQMSLTEYYGQPADGEMVLVLGTDIMEERALKSGDQIYLPQDYRKHLSESEILLGQWKSADSICDTVSHLRSYPASEAGDGDVWLRGWNGLSESRTGTEIHRSGFL